MCIFLREKTQDWAFKFSNDTEIIPFNNFTCYNIKKNIDKNQNLKTLFST